MLSDPTLFSLIPDPLLVFDGEGVLLRANPAAVRLLGLTAGSTESQSLLDHCHPEDRARLDAALKRLTTGEAVRFGPVRFPGKGEAFRWFDWHTCALASGGNVLAMGHDVTDARMAETELRESLTQLHEGELIAGMGSWSWDARSGKRRWSEGLYELFGFAPGSVAPSFETFLELLPPVSQDRVMGAIDQVLIRKAPVELQYIINHTSGSQRVLHVRMKPFHDDEGHVIGYTGTALDITDRQAVEQALAASESTYRALMEHASDATLVANAQGRFIDANRRAVELLGYSKEELLNMAPPDIHPSEDQAVVREAFRQMESTGTSLFEHKVRTKDGRLVAVEVAGTRISRGDGHVFLGSFRNISQRKKHEAELWRKSEELEAVFANLHLCIAVMDHEFNFLRVNAAYAEAAGIAREMIVGRHHFDLYPDEENEHLFRHAVTTGNSISMEAKLFHHPRLGPTYWDWTLTPFRDPEGEVEGAVLTLIDVSEREHQRRVAVEAWQRAQADLERRVQNRTEELEAAIRELEAFSYSVSHDLLGPLRAINGFSAALREDCGEAVGEHGRGYLNRIQAATLRMSEQMDGLLGLSRVFRTELQTCDVDLSELARQVIRELFETEPERMVEIEIEPDLHTRGDNTLLRLLLQNLLGNAWKFTAKQSTARIEFGRVDRNGRTVFFIRDNGVGFELEYAHKLFQPFQRLHREEDFRGTGIGLATVRRIVHRHGGEVWAEGHPDRGAIFFFALPTEDSPRETSRLQVKRSAS